MKHAADTLEALGIAHDAASSRHTARRSASMTSQPSAKSKGFKVIIAGAGGAAHLPGMTAAMTPLPVFGVPVESKALSGQDSLLSIVQMPAGIPVGTLAIGKAGAINAALLAASVLALGDPALAQRLDAWRARQTATVAERRRTRPDAAVLASSTRRRDRHPRRRAAGTHAGAGRGPTRLPLPHLRPRERQPRLPVSAAQNGGELHRLRRPAQLSRARWTS